MNNINKSKQSPSSGQSTKHGRGVTLLILAGICLGGYFYFNANSSGTASKSSETRERQKAYQQAIETTKKESWPSTPQSLITQFWEAASRKDYKRLTQLCPGSKESDYRAYYDKWTSSPAKSIGSPTPHPQYPAVQLYPVTVSFPGFPNKTIKMAITKAQDGRFIIDGEKTIWW